jgi:hypothetical protein
VIQRCGAVVGAFTVAWLADGRLTQAELVERAGAAYAAQTRAQLRDLTADLPAAQEPPRPGMVLDRIRRR